MDAKMEELIFQTGKAAPAHSYLVKPISGSLRAALNTSDIPDLKVPKVTIICSINEVVARLEQNQYSTVQDVVVFMRSYIKSRRFIELRPSVPIHSNART